MAETPRTDALIDALEGILPGIRQTHTTALVATEVAQTRRIIDDEDADAEVAAHGVDLLDDFRARLVRSAAWRVALIEAIDRRKAGGQ